MPELEWGEFEIRSSEAGGVGLGGRKEGSSGDMDTLG